MEQQNFTFISNNGNTLKLSENELSKYEYLTTLIDFKNKSGNVEEFKKLEDYIFDFIQKTYKSEPYPINQKEMAAADFLRFNFWNEYYPTEYINILNSEEELIDITDIKINYSKNIVPSIISNFGDILEIDEISENLLYFKIIVHLLSEFKDNIVIAGGFALAFYSKKYRTTDIDLFLYNCNKNIAMEILNILKVKSFEFLGFIYELNSIEESKYAYTFHFISKRKYIKIQLIKLIHKNKLDIITNFDLGICQVLLTLDSKIEATQKFIYCLNNEIIVVEFDKLSEDLESRICRYHQKGFSVFMPFFSYFKKYCKKDFSKNTNLKGKDVLTNYIYSQFEYINYYYRYGGCYNPEIPNFNIVHIDDLSEEFLFGNCGRFGSYLIEDYSDWYPEYKYPELEIPIFDNSIVHIDYSNVKNNNYYKKYLNVYRKFTKPSDTKILDENLLYFKSKIVNQIKNIILKIIGTEEYVAYGKFAYTLLENTEYKNFNICINFIKVKESSKDISKLLDKLLKKIKFRKIIETPLKYTINCVELFKNYKIIDQINFNVWIDEIIKTEQQILELNLNDVENVILKCVNKKLEFVTTDEILWSAQNKINTKNNKKENYGKILDKNFDLIKNF